MDRKRANAPATRQGASKTSVNSRHLNANVARKFGSEVSLTPSQAKQNAENARKSPLDALSRLNNRQDPFQRRSGLQDVDDNFLASNAFVRPSRVRHTGLDGNVPIGGSQAVNNAAVAPMRVASGQETPQMQMQYQQQQQLPPLSAQPPVAASQQPLQQQQQPPAAQQQMTPAAVMPSQQSLPAQQQQQQPQQFVQPPAAGQPTRHEPYTSGRAHVQHQQQLPQQQQQQQAAYEQQAQPEAQSQAQLQAQQHQQQPPSQSSPRKFQQQQQQQQGYAGQPTAAGGAPAPEMCTTCPNCQTTIYLVRTPEMGHGDGGMPLQ